MKQISAIALSLLLIIGLTAEAHAVTQGVYKCYVPEGSFDGGTTVVFPVIWHYNPNATGNHSITRLRIFDSAGTALTDQGFSPGTYMVPRRGATPISLAIGGGSQALQVIVNWQQTVDAQAPIARIDLFLDNGANFTSVSQSNCP